MSPILNELGQKRTIVTVSDKTFHNISEHFNVSDSIRERISRTNLLLVPQKVPLHEDYILAFPEGTIEFFNFLKVNKPDELSIDILVEEKDYKELTLHADIVRIAEILTTVVLAPIVVNLISAHLLKRLGKRRDEAIVKSKLVIVNEGENKQTIEITYEGPVNEFQSTMLNTLSDRENLLLQDSTPLRQLESKPVRKSSNKTKKRNKKHRK